jgi:hypothetical protein
MGSVKGKHGIGPCSEITLVTANGDARNIVTHLERCVVRDSHDAPLYTAAYMYYMRTIGWPLVFIAQSAVICRASFSFARWATCCCRVQYQDYVISSKAQPSPRVLRMLEAVKGLWDLGMPADTVCHCSAVRRQHVTV